MNQPRRAEVEIEHAGEREVGRHVQVLERQQREAGSHDQLARGLAALAQPEVPRLAHAEVVVDEADDRHPDDECHEGEPGPREPDLLGADVRDEVGDDRAADDRDATHRRRARLGHVRVRERPVVADLLADVVAHEDADQERRAEDAEHERHAEGDEERDHERVPGPAHSLRDRDLAVEQRSRHDLEPDRAAALHQHRVAGPERRRVPRRARRGRRARP